MTSTTLTIVAISSAKVVSDILVFKFIQSLHIMVTDANITFYRLITLNT
jgi:hypothetical protein